MKLVKLLAAVLILTAAVFAIRRWCWVPVHCSVIAGRVDRRLGLLETASLYEIEIGTRRNLQMIEPCVAAMPWNVVWRELAAQNYRLREDHENVRRQYELALQYDKRPEFHFRLGMALLALGREDEARPHLMIGGTVWPHYLLRLPQPMQNEMLNRVYEIRKGN